MSKRMVTTGGQRIEALNKPAFRRLIGRLVAAAFVCWVTFAIYTERSFEAVIAILLVGTSSTVLVRSVARTESHGLQGAPQYFSYAKGASVVAIIAAIVGTTALQLGSYMPGVLFVTCSVIAVSVGFRILVYVECRDALAIQFESETAREGHAFACGRFEGFSGLFRPLALLVAHAGNLEIYSAWPSGPISIAATDKPSVRILKLPAFPTPGVAEFDFGYRKMVVNDLNGVELDSVLEQIGVTVMSEDAPSTDPVEQ